LKAFFGAKAVCVARNWRGHIQELGNEEPEQPVFFIKPSSALCSLSEPIRLPTWSQDVQHEVELALLIDNRLHEASVAEVQAGISRCALSIDLTARDIQTALKAKGLPWEKAKAFDCSLPIGPWISLDGIGPLSEVELRLSVNGQLRQCGQIKQMIHSPFALVSEASRYFTLLPGDVVVTGTPAGVGRLRVGDQLKLSLNQSWHQSTEVIGG